MCDFFSWGVLKPSVQKQLGLKSRLIWLEDDMAQALIDRGPVLDRIRGFSWADVAGHSAIAAYYRISEGAFKHKEGTYRIPRAALKAINAGKMDKIQQAATGEVRRFTAYGVKGPKIPDYLLPAVNRDIVAIKRYCEETSQQKKARNALMVYKAGVRSRGQFGETDIDSALTWSMTPQKEEFWAEIWYRQTGEKRWESLTGPVWKLGSPGTATPEAPLPNKRAGV